MKPGRLASWPNPKNAPDHDVSFCHLFIVWACNSKNTIPAAPANQAFRIIPQLCMFWEVRCQTNCKNSPIVQHLGTARRRQPTSLPGNLWGLNHASNGCCQTCLNFGTAFSSNRYFISWVSSCLGGCTGSPRQVCPELSHFRPSSKCHDLKSKHEPKPNNFWTRPSTTFSAQDLMFSWTLPESLGFLRHCQSVNPHASYHRQFEVEVNHRKR